MTRIILNGCCGRMGRMISEISAGDKDIEIVAGADVYDNKKNDYPVYPEISRCNEEADVIVDFSLPDSLEKLLSYAVTRKLPVVLCTTGLTEEQLSKVKEASEKVAILRSANMSLGINILLKVLKSISPVLSENGFDIEIVEKHHREKKDAPSGTALALAEAVNDSLKGKKDFVYDRSRRSERRPDSEIGISAVRGGTIPGDHDIIFAGEDEVITLSHRAYSRAVFAKGALAAAAYLKDKAPGMYDMGDVLK